MLLNRNAPLCTRYFVRPLRGRSRYSGRVGTESEGLYHCTQDLGALVALAVPSESHEPGSPFSRLAKWEEVASKGSEVWAPFAWVQSYGTFCCFKKTFRKQPDSTMKVSAYPSSR